MNSPRRNITVQRFSLVVLVLGLGLYCSPSRSASAQDTCIGDCGGTNSVGVDELIVMVNIALSTADRSACARGIPDGTPMTIAMVVQAVDNAMNGCKEATETPSSAPTETPNSAPTATPSSGPTATPSSTPPLPTPTLTPTPRESPAFFCDLPGSVQSTAPGVAIVPGGRARQDVSYVHLPAGFCAHFFADIGNTRQLRFAPGGELFVASPRTGTTGGGSGGRAAILVLPDDDHDGEADSEEPFLGGDTNCSHPSALCSTQGLLFTGGYFYYQDATRIMRVPYTPGDRAPSAASEQVANITIYTSPLHWPKALDVADDGTIYVANGGDEGEQCDQTLPFHGGILKLDGSPGGTPVARGFRNPISLRCARGYGMCFAIELTKDYSTPMGGREKLLPIRDGDDWGFPCCATRNVPFPDLFGGQVPDCSNVQMEIDSFFVGNTPFDLDFETGKWPQPWTYRAFVPQHGAYGTWTGARLVAIDFDTMTGLVLPGSDLGGMSTGAMADFATGWDKVGNAHGRPANVAFAPDGRLFLGNDNNGHIIWIAPMDLPIP